MSKDGRDSATLILMKISHFDRTALYPKNSGKLSLRGLPLSYNVNLFDPSPTYSNFCVKTPKFSEKYYVSHFFAYPLTLIFDNLMSLTIVLANGVGPGCV